MGLASAVVVDCQLVNHRGRLARIAVGDGDGDLVWLVGVLGRDATELSSGADGNPAREAGRGPRVVAGDAVAPGRRELSRRAAGIVSEVSAWTDGGRAGDRQLRPVQGPPLGVQGDAGAE